MKSQFRYTEGPASKRAFEWVFTVSKLSFRIYGRLMWFSNPIADPFFWAFTKEGIPKYCSVTVPLYVGLGASGGSYLKDIFYLNTFNVAEYIKTLENGRMPKFDLPPVISPPFKLVPSV